jgi:hypothetical protein
VQDEAEAIVGRARVRVLVIFEAIAWGNMFGTPRFSGVNRLVLVAWRFLFINKIIYGLVLVIIYLGNGGELEEGLRGRRELGILVGK